MNKKSAKTSGKVKRSPRKRFWRRFGLAAGGAVVLGALIGAGLVAVRAHPGFVPAGIRRFVLPPPENILLIGNNARNPAGPLDIGTGGGGQADILMVAHIDPSTKKVVLISIPRNVLFAMPQYNNPIPKIKSLFFIGAQETPNQAAQLSVQAVQQLTGLHINHWVVTDFQGFVDAINAVGGVRIDVPGRLYDPYYSHANLYPGWQTLTGEQALAFIRIRQNLASNSVRVNDFQRMDAEVQVIDALKHKLLSASSDLTHLSALMATWHKDVATDMSTVDLFNLATSMVGAKITHLTIGNIGDSLQLASSPAQGFNAENYITGAYYDVINPAHVYQMLKPYGSTGSSTGLPSLPSPQSVPVEVYGSQDIVSRLKKAGFSQVTYMGSGNTYPVQVMYPNGQMPWGWAVGRALATGNGMVEPGSPNPNAVVVYGD